VKVRAEKTICDEVEMLWVAVVVGLSIDIGIVEESDGSDFICNDYDGLSKDLLNLHNLVVGVVLMPHTFKF